MKNEIFQLESTKRKDLASGSFFFPSFLSSLLLEEYSILAEEQVSEVRHKTRKGSRSERIDEHLFLSNLTFYDQRFTHRSLFIIITIDVVVVGVALLLLAVDLHCYSFRVFHISSRDREEKNGLSALDRVVYCFNQSSIIMP